MYGSEMKISIAHQSSYGTPNANVSSYTPIPILSESLAGEKPPLEIQNMRGVFDAGPTKEGPNTIGGGFEAEANPICIGDLLKAVVGQPVSSAVGSAYSHVFAPVTSDFDQFAALRPVSIVKDFGDGSSADLFYDMIGSKLTLSIANGELLKASAEFMGGKQSQRAAVASTFEDTARAWTWDVASVSFGGVAVEEIRDMSITIDNALANKHTLNASKEPSRTKRDGFRTCAVEGTIMFETMSHYQDWKNQAEQTVLIHLASTGSEVASGYTDSLTISVPTFKYDEFKANASGPGQIEVPIKGRAIYNVGSGHSVQFTLVNTKSAY